MRSTTAAPRASLGIAARQGPGHALIAALVLATVMQGLGGCASDAEPGAAASGQHATSRTTTTTAGAERLTVVASFHLHQITHLVPTPTELWVLGGPSRKVTEVDPGTDTVRRTLTLPHPAAFGTYAGGWVWISSFADSVVMQVDPATGRVVRTVRGTAATPLDHPVGLVATGSTVWVVQHRKAVLTRIDARTGGVIGDTVLPGDKAGDPAVEAGRIWVPVTDDEQSVTRVVQVDPATARVDGSPISVGSLQCGLSSIAEGRLWVTSPGASPCSNAVSALDLASETLSPTAFGSGKDLFEVVSVGGATWASDTRSTIYRLDTASGRVTPSLTLDGAPDYNQLTAAFGSLWVTRGDTGRLLRVRVG